MPPHGSIPFRIRFLYLDQGGGNRRQPGDDAEKKLGV
jgi:hypothetical protein